jgi:DNA-binding response OmpR family regulator
MRILIIEDNKSLCDAMCFQLQNEGYSTDACYSGENALYYALNPCYDVIILDRMLPVIDGLTILKKLRSNHLPVPVILVTAMDGLHDRVNGLDAGADDYLVKPFAMEELLARIRALSRRPQRLGPEGLLSFSGLEFDAKEQLLISGSKSCNLSKRETELLEYFMKNPNQVLPRETIISHVCGLDNFVEDGNLDNYIHFLRRRLSSVGSNVQIKTIHSVGYRLQSSEA